MDEADSPVRATPRSLTARSVVASTLLGTDPPRLPVSFLVRTGELFGLAEGTVRTALSRMAAAGEVRTSGDGWYALDGAMVERQQRQHRSRAAATVDWSGRWRMAVVVAGARPPNERVLLRTEMGRLRMAEFHDAVWLRPDNLDRQAPSSTSTVVDSHCAVVLGRPRSGSVARPRRRSPPSCGTSRAGKSRRSARPSDWSRWSGSNAATSRSWHPVSCCRHPFCVTSATTHCCRASSGRGLDGARSEGQLRRVRGGLPRSPVQLVVGRPGDLTATVAPRGRHRGTTRPGAGARQRPGAAEAGAAVFGDDRFYFRQLLAGRDFATTDPVAGQMVNFVYLIGDRASRECLVVDPAYGVREIADVAAADEMTLTGALVTHYHPDHCGGNMMGMQIEGIAELLALSPMPVHVQADEAEWVTKVTELSPGDLTAHGPGDSVMVGEIPIRLLHTPGHTPGSQCFFVNGCLVSGDTLFLDGCGGTDLPGGDPEQLYFSLTQTLAQVPDDAVLFPGHQYSAAPAERLGDTRSRNVVFRPGSVEQWMMMFG